MCALENGLHPFNEAPVVLHLITLLFAVVLIRSRLQATEATPKPDCCTAKGSNGHGCSKRSHPWIVVFLSTYLFSIPAADTACETGHSLRGAQQREGIIVSAASRSLKDCCFSQ